MKMATCVRSEQWTPQKIYFLFLMTISYIIGEITHFLINTTSREVARDIHYGDMACYSYIIANHSVKMLDVDCRAVSEEEQCGRLEHCSWEYSGLGLDYQLLSGPAFISVFTVSGVLLAILSDWLHSRLPRPLVLAAGTLTFSTSCLLMGVARQYWQLVVLRMGIAAGESVCRPTSGSLIADLFSSSSRGVANGIFSWGVYYGYGLAFVIGIYGSQADILGFGWRAPYVLVALPGIVIAVLLATTVKDPRQDVSVVRSNCKTKNVSAGSYIKTLGRSFSNPAMLLLLLGAAVRHTAGYSWAYNTRLYFQEYYPDYDLGYWILLSSIIGGSFGVFAGGFFSDRLVRILGLHSRLWLLSLCTLVASPFAVGVLYFPPPGAFGCLVGYYFFAETWFAVLFTVIVEIVPADVRSTSIAIFLFFMNQVGGNLPVIVTPLKHLFQDYRSALYVVWPGFAIASSVLFLLSSLPLWIRRRRSNSSSYNVNTE